VTTRPARTVSISVDCDPRTAYRYVTDPRTLPDWAPGFARSVREDGTAWYVETPTGDVRVDFVVANDLGVADHRVTDGAGLDVWNPMRVLGNGTGAEILFTVFRRDGMSEEEFQRDLGLVQSDLSTLKRRLEPAPG